MSAFSDWRVGALSDDEYKQAMRRECYDRIYPDASPDDYYQYTCENCEYCRLGKRFTFDVVVREADGKHVLKQTREYTFTNYCVKDIENIREIKDYDDVCEDHGELFREEDT